MEKVHKILRKSQTNFLANPIKDAGPHVSHVHSQSHYLEADCVVLQKQTLIVTIIS